MKTKITTVAILLGVIYILAYTMSWLYPKDVKHMPIKDSTSNPIDTVKIDTVKIDTVVTKVEKKKTIKIMASLPRNFHKVPAGTHVYRSAQPTISQLKDVLSEYPIDVVVRMNAAEGTGVSIEDEHAAVESMGKKFVWINAHMGFKEGKGYLESIKQVQPYLDSGNVLIHCAAGKDRTGYQVAKFIERQKGWSKDELWKYTVELNDWELHICQGKKGYIRYMEAFYPYEEWKTKNYCK